MNNKERSLAEEITEGLDALKRIRELEAEIAELKDEVAKWKMSYENSIRFEDGYGHN
jgi:hypothetical protein